MMALPAVILLGVAADHFPHGKHAELGQMLGQAQALRAQMYGLQADFKAMREEIARAQQRSRKFDRELLEELRRRGLELPKD